MAREFFGGKRREKFYKRLAGDRRFSLWGRVRRCCTAGIKCVCPPHAALSVAVKRATSLGVRGFKKKSKVCAETELF